jgi:hypothetical protein
LAWSSFIRAAKAIAEEGSFMGFDGSIPFAEKLDLALKVAASTPVAQRGSKAQLAPCVSLGLFYARASPALSAGAEPRQFMERFSDGSKSSRRAKKQTFSSTGILTCVLRSIIPGIAVGIPNSIKL